MPDIQKYLRHCITNHVADMQTEELVFPELHMPGNGREGFVPGTS